MVLCEETLFIAGPPDLFEYAPEGAADVYHSTPPEALREQEAALAGERGALLLAVSAENGKRLAEYELDTSPVFDGMVAADGRLFVSMLDGRVICFAKQ